MEDKLSMAHGLESRVPFLDDDLVRLACQIPVHHKLRSLSPGDTLDENLLGSPHASSNGPVRQASASSGDERVDPGRRRRCVQARFQRP